MNDLTSKTIDDFLNEVAARTPTPGGGSVIALAAASACALARMVVAYSDTKSTAAGSREALGAAVAVLANCDQLCRALITADSRAYKALRDAGKGESPGRQEAVLGACAVPLEVATASVEALRALDGVKGLVSERFVSDLAAAAFLLSSAVLGATHTAATNAAELADEQQVERVVADCEKLVGQGMAYVDAISEVEG